MTAALIDFTGTVLLGKGQATCSPNSRYVTDTTQTLEYTHPTIHRGFDF